jgi:hypothetical protein
VLIDYIKRDNQLNTADSLKASEAINLSQAFFKLYRQTRYLTVSQHRFKALAAHKQQRV